MVIIFQYITVITVFFFMNAVRVCLLSIKHFKISPYSQRFEKSKTNKEIVCVCVCVCVCLVFCILSDGQT